MPIARHGQLRSPGAVGQLLKLIGIAMAVVLVSGIGVATFVVGGMLNTVSANAVQLDHQKELPPDIAAYKGGFDILLTGVDTCEPKYAAGARLFTLGVNGPDYDLGQLRELVAWRDARNG